MSRVFAKNHVLFREREPINRIYIIKEGWARRTQSSSGRRLRTLSVTDFALASRAQPGMALAVGMTLMGRTEVLEISVSKLRQNYALQDAVLKLVAQHAPPPLGSFVNYKPAVHDGMLAAQERLIDTGLVDGTNLLVMDMDLCVRCGNCSLACHKIHGQSRLMRRGVHVTRLDAPRASAVQTRCRPKCLSLR
jgi:ferredoxin